MTGSNSSVGIVGKSPSIPKTPPIRTPSVQPETCRPQSPKPDQSGIMGQMAATAGGVAIGSAVGHALFSGVPTSQAANVAQGSPAVNKQGDNSCAQQMEDFIQCAKNSSGDPDTCRRFAEALRECKSGHWMH